MSETEMKNILVIGGGAAGMMAAWSAVRAGGVEVTLLEKNPVPGKKLCITGKGRCNVTSSCESDALQTHVLRNPRFLYSAFSAFSNLDTMAFFEAHGVPLKVERGERVFPVSDHAYDIRDALRSAAEQAGVRFRRGTAERILTADGSVSGVSLQQGGVLEADCVILATGGLSYPATGSTGDGYRMARETGHRIEEPFPSLVPLIIREPLCARAQGLSLKNVRLTLCSAAGKELFSDQGEMLFTHFGISGPLVLTASGAIPRGSAQGCRVLIDLKPALSEAQLDARLLRDFSAGLNRDYRNSLSALLPSKLIEPFVELSAIPPTLKVHDLTKAQRMELLRLLKGLPLTVDGLRPIAEAIVTAGGVNVRDVSPSTMESKRVSGLYFAGELLDVDATTGGFNLQIAFSTGFLAGRSAAADCQSV